jgi:hypothetical protein
MGQTIYWAKLKINVQCFNYTYKTSVTCHAYFNKAQVHMTKDEKTCINYQLYWHFFYSKASSIAIKYNYGCNFK